MTKSTWNKFAHEGMNVYALPADGNYYGKRIFHHVLATETNRVMILMALWKKMLLKSAGNFDSDPWLLTHLSVLNFMKGDWIRYLLTIRTRQQVQEFAFMGLLPKMMLMAFWKKNKCYLKAPKITIQTRDYWIIFQFCFYKKHLKFNIPVNFIFKHVS